MAIDVIGRDGSATGACMYDTTTDWAFGPVFENAEECDEFMRWANSNAGIDDVRRLVTSDLEELYSQWLRSYRRYEMGLQYLVTVECDICHKTLGVGVETHIHPDQPDAGSIPLDERFNAAVNAGIINVEDYGEDYRPLQPAQ